MYLTDSEIAERFGTKRPGRELIAIENAALPISVLGAQILAQEEKGFPLLDEFVLRSARHGLKNAQDITEFLGMEEGVLDSALASQLAAGNITYNPSGKTVSLTLKGDTAAHDLTSITPVELELPVVFDRLIWRVADYREGDLLTRKEALRQDMILLAPAQSMRINRTHVRPKDIEDLVARGRDSSLNYQVLDVERVRARKHRYLPVKLLIFSDGMTSSPDLMILIDGEDSPYHENQLAINGGAANLGISLAPALSPLETPEAIAEDVSATLGESVTEPSATAAPAVLITQISVFDHANHLKQALRDAKRRVLIISPWIRGAVVDTTFIADVERKLRAGVPVAIGHGYGPDDSGSDANALRRLHNLQQRYDDTFTLARLPNTHAKVLIYDDTYITTSFNWLSFRGDPDRTYRMEEGTLVQSHQYADKAFERYAAELAPFAVR